MTIDIKELAKKYSIKSPGVLHIGAHIGQEAPMYQELGMEKMIFIEANPSIYDQLVGNIAKYPQAKAIKACVSEKDGESVVFNISSNDGQSSSILELGTHKNLHPEVSYLSSLEMNTSRVDTVLRGMDMTGVRFLNIDLQGMELPALKSMGNLLYNFEYAYLEVNREQVYVGCAEIEEIDKYLSIFGFVRKETNWVNGWGDAFYIKESKEVLPGTFSDPIVFEYQEKGEQAPTFDNKLNDKKIQVDSGMIVQVEANFLPISESFEAWFAENISSSELNTRMYLPVQWSAYYMINKNGRDSTTMGHLQYLLDSLDKSKKYFTICEWPEGVMNYFNGKDIKVFGPGEINIDYKIDVKLPFHELKKYIIETIK